MFLTDFINETVKTRFYVQCDEAYPHRTMQDAVKALRGRKLKVVQKAVIEDTDPNVEATSVALAEGGAMADPIDEVYKPTAQQIKHSAMSAFHHHNSQAAEADYKHREHLDIAKGHSAHTPELESHHKEIAKAYRSVALSHVKMAAHHAKKAGVSTD